MIEIHELIIEARVTDSSPSDYPAGQHYPLAAHYEKQLVDRITEQVMRQVLTQLREESGGMR